MYNVLLKRVNKGGASRTTAETPGIGTAWVWREGEQGKQQDEKQMGLNCRDLLQVSLVLQGRVGAGKSKGKRPLAKEPHTKSPEG